MRISSAISLPAQNGLKRTTAAIAKSLERLALGKRVISPRDDIGAYDLGVSLQAQARGLTQANLNTNQTINLIETAGSAIETQLDILQDLRDIALEASSSNLTSNERQQLQDEVLSLLDEYRRIIAQTEFNGTKLLDGSFGSKSIQIGANTQSSLSLRIGSLKASDVFKKTVGTGSFMSRTTVTSLQESRAVVLEDFNQDGKLDMAVTAIASGLGIGVDYLQIFDGKGDGSFLQARQIATDRSPNELRAGDITGDGITDLVTIGYDEQSSVPRISIFAGNGDGTFDSPTYVNTGSTPVDVELVDLNSDGLLDLVSLDPAAGQISRFLNQGSGSFSEAETDSVSTDRQTLGSGDLNADGNIDVIVGGGASSSASLFLGSSTGSLTAGTAISSLGRSITGFVVADLDLDGDLDIAASNTNTTRVNIALNSGTGTFTSSAANTVGTRAEDIKGADLNKDGYMDLFVLNEDSRSISVLLGNGAASYTNATTLALGGTSTFGAFDMALGDIDNDGVIDIVSPQTGNTSAIDGVEISIIRSLTSLESAERDLSVQSAGKAQELLDFVDSAISRILKENASISAVHSRLETTYALNLLLIEKYNEAQSDATDIDFTLETAELVRQQILQQAQTAALAQANLSLQAVLALLDF